MPVGHLFSAKSDVCLTLRSEFHLTRNERPAEHTHNIEFQKPPARMPALKFRCHEAAAIQPATGVEWLWFCRL